MACKPQIWARKRNLRARFWVGKGNMGTEEELLRQILGARSVGPESAPQGEEG